MGESKPEKERERGQTAPTFGTKLSQGITGSAATCDGRCVMAGVSVGVAIGNELDDSGDLGLYGGGRAGFITMSSAIPSVDMWVVLLVSTESPLALHSL